MVQKLPKNLVRRLPGIGWRDVQLERRVAQVGELRNQVARLEEQVRKAERKARSAKERHARVLDELRHLDGSSGAGLPPSYLRHLRDRRRTVDDARPIDPDRALPVLQIARKLRNYWLAASHGVRVPEVYASWMTLDEIDLSGMPERFVLKSEGGAGGRGVVPLRRVDENRFAMIGGDEVFTRDDLVQRYRDRPTAFGPFFAEGFLVQEEAREFIPDDVKVYATYGEIAHIRVRRVPGQDGHVKDAHRFVDENGQDLGDDVAPWRRIDSSIPLPRRFEEIVEIGRHLSRAVALPFIRVDVYDTVDAVVFGELTRSPGGPQRYRKDHDALMGLMWDRAQVRLDLDVINGRPLKNLHGHHPTVNPYPAGHPARSGRPATWVPEVVPCERWCFPDRPASAGVQP